MVFNADLWQGTYQFVLVEMRKFARARELTNIGEGLDVMGGKRLVKFIKTECRMTDRPDIEAAVHS